MSKSTFFILLLLFLSNLLSSQNVFINEVNYAATNTNDRGVGVAGPSGTDLNNWQIILYDNGGSSYHTENIQTGTHTTIIPNQSNSRGEIWYPVAGLQAPNDANVALVNNGGSVVQFISFGTPAPAVTAVDGAASGSSSTAETIIQTNNNNALQLTGSGLTYTDFAWSGLVASTPGAVNTGQTFTALPVELIEFKGMFYNEKVKLTWSTASEKNNAKFIIEHSTNGQFFEAIGEVIGNGTTTEKQYYEYMDLHPENGWNYYRLKQIDFDGEETIHSVLSILNGKENILKVYPNPITDHQQLNVQLNTEGDFIFKLLNTNGQVMREIFFSNDTVIDLEDILSGIYIYQIIDKDGQVVTSDRLVKVN